MLLLNGVVELNVLFLFYWFIWSLCFVCGMLKKLILFCLVIKRVIEKCKFFIIC